MRMALDNMIQKHHGDANEKSRCVEHVIKKSVRIEIIVYPLISLQTKQNVLPGVSSCHPKPGPVSSQLLSSQPYCPFIH